jgi:hypothetical protein
MEENREIKSNLYEIDIMRGRHNKNLYELNRLIEVLNKKIRRLSGY